MIILRYNLNWGRRIWAAWIVYQRAAAWRMGARCDHPRVSGPQLTYNYRVSEEDRELMGRRPGNELWAG